MIAFLTDLQHRLVLRRLRKGMFISESVNKFEDSELFLVKIDGFEFHATLLYLQPCRGEVVRPVGLPCKFIEDAYDYDNHVAESLWLAATIRQRAKDKLYLIDEVTW